MSTTIMEEQLLSALVHDSTLAARGCAARRELSGGIVISVGGNVVGQWVWRAGMFVFAPAGSATPTRSAETVAEAVSHTRAEVGA